MVDPKARFVGKTLHDVPTPCAVLDLAKLEVNCQQMLDTVDRLSLLWRPHIKTHKTTELTRLQVGDDRSAPANIVVSTVAEAENIVPLLKEYKSKGRNVNVLYGFPLYTSVVDRLAAVASALGPGGLSLMVDHVDQIPLVEGVFSKSGGVAPQVFVKIDMGYRRSGVIPNTPECEAVIDAVIASARKDHCAFHAIYAHAGHSYETRQDWQALDYLAAEFKALEEVASSIKAKGAGDTLVLSVGATPTTTSLQHPVVSDRDSAQSDGPGIVSGHLKNLKAQGFQLEVHAGVYPTLDLQQLATHARDKSLMSASSIAISVLVEVASLYPRRGPSETTEALINAGCLALGREPCADMGKEKGKDYNGFGIVVPWGLDNPVPGTDFPSTHGGWQVGKVSQEHGILRWRGEPGDEIALKVGQRVRIWPNHACVAGACYDQYLVVDSRREGKESEIVDVWQRWRGW